MIYTPLTKKAMKIAHEAHMGQFDKSGVPYIYHPIHLAEQMKEEFLVCAALLHDVVEDTCYTFDDLAAEGIPEPVLTALKLLTHDKSVSYQQYILSIRQNPIAREVKLADLEHNSDISRLDTIDANAIKRIQKYTQAIRILKE